MCMNITGIRHKGEYRRRRRGEDIDALAKMQVCIITCIIVTSPLSDAPVYLSARQCSAQR
jgi:hypothetical protein